MANTGVKGIDVRQTGTALVFRAFMQTSAGALVTTGTTSLYLQELQSDGSIKTYDFSTNTFSSTAVTTETASMTYRKSNNAATDTGLWTYALSVLTGFTAGAVYLIRVNNPNAYPTDQYREIQFGGDQGDLAVLASGSSGVGYLETDVESWRTGAVPATSATGVPVVDPHYWSGGAVPAPSQTGVPITDAHYWSGSIVATPSVSGVPVVDVHDWSGSAVATPAITGVPVVDVHDWSGSAVSSPSTAGVPIVDTHYWIAGLIPAQTTAGIPDVNVKEFAGSAAAVDTNGFPRIAGPYKINTASGFAFAMVSSSDHVTPYTGGSVSAVRSIAGGSESAVGGTITQIGATNRYYFAGSASDFNGASIEYTFSATGADPVTVSINTTP